MRVNRRRRPGMILAALGLVAVVTVGGCGGSASDESSSTQSGADRAGDAAAPQAPAEAPPAKGGAAPGGAAPGPADGDAPAEQAQRIDQRAIIYTGSMRVRVKDVEKAATETIRLVTAAGGFVGGDRRSGGSDTREADLELRVPAARFTQVIDQIAGLGEQLRRDVNTEDVTEQSIDLDARIATQQARVASGRRLLAQAKNLSDLVMLEGELAKRESDLASLEAKKRRLADLTSLSTVTVTLIGPDQPATPEEDEEQLGFLAGLAGGWEAFVASLRVLLTVLGALLPWLIALGLPLAGLFWLLRRRRRNRPAGYGELAPQTAHPTPGPVGRPAPTGPLVQPGSPVQSGPPRQPGPPPQGGAPTRPATEPPASATPSAP